ncbi:MAG: hypothetical protein NUV77_27105, partial [Thermoguttaceae bacterium]|nr:hypothetical protein [Thermoguttaceae bacterium]
VRFRRGWCGAGPRAARRQRYRERYSAGEQGPREGQRRTSPAGSEQVFHEHRWHNVPETGGGEHASADELLRQKDLIRSVVESKISTAREPGAVDYRPVDETEARRLESQTGLDLRGYVHMVDKSAINHIFKEYGLGREWRRHHGPVTGDDILRVAEIFAAPDSSRLLPRKGRDIDAIEHRKRFDGITFVIEEVRTGKKRLALQTMYKVEAGATGATTI